MKQLSIIAVSLMISISLYSQDVTLYSSGKLDGGILTYDSVIVIPGVSKQDLYRRVAAFISKTFPVAAITANDSLSGIVRVSSNDEYVQTIAFQKMAYRIKFQLTIQYKDGKCKYSIDNITAGAESTLYEFPVTVKQFKDDRITPKKGAYIAGGVNALNLLAQSVETALTTTVKDNTNF